MIKEDYVSYEVAKLLKEKGFDQNCATYYLDGQVWRHYHGEVIPKGKQIYAAPTQAMVMKWLRKVHNIVIGVNVLNENNRGNTDYSNPDRWWYFWEFTDTKGVYKEELQPDPLSNEYSTYEDAAEAAIKYCLENLI